MRAVLAVVVPAAAGYALLARPIVALVLRHGALAANRAQVTADVLALLAVGLPGFSAWYVVTRAFQAMQDTRTVFWLYVLENGVNVIGALALAPRWGVQGVAFSYSIAYTVATLTGLVALRRRAGPLEGTRLARSVARIGGATAAMAVVVGVASVLLHTPALRVGVGVSAGVTVYFVVARRLGVDELAALLPSRGTAE